MPEPLIIYWRMRYGLVDGALQWSKPIPSSSFACCEMNVPVLSQGTSIAQPLLGLFPCRKSWHLTHGLSTVEVS